MTRTSNKFKYADVKVTLIQDDGKSDLDMSLIFIEEYQGMAFQMIESTAYFESYNHVLTKIQFMAKWKNFIL